MLVSQLKNWAPFRLDALGLVTLLGAGELDIAIGRLVKNHFTEYLPLLGAYIIAGDNITKPIPGFTLYNITDGILASDVTGWFARWLMCQNLSSSSCTITIQTLQPQRFSNYRIEISSAIIGIAAILPILVFAVLIEDWWGFANAVSMLLSVIVRRVVVGQLRSALDLATQKAINTSTDYIKTFWAMPGGTVVIIKAPRGVVIDCLLTNPCPPNRRLYNWMKILGWAGFGCHVITLGMSTLFSQILSVCLLLVATILVVRQIGDYKEHIGSSLLLRCETFKGECFRAVLYSRMNLSDKEEASMVSWNLMPHRSNETWWQKYRDCKAKGDFQTWEKVLKESYETRQV
jgi:hypothetical protein